MVSSSSWSSCVGRDLAIIVGIRQINVLLNNEGIYISMLRPDLLSPLESQLGQHDVHHATRQQ